MTLVNTFEAKRLLTFLSMNARKTKVISGVRSRDEVTVGACRQLKLVILSLRVQRFLDFRSQSQTGCGDGKDIFAWVDCLLGKNEMYLHIAF